LLCKGADSIIEARLKQSACPHLEKTKEYVDGYAEEGLRTLFLAKKKLTSSEYYQWNALFEDAL
jgi:magnesium-transporting ATPase (P-type)